MTNQDVFDLALAYLAEESETDCSDYEARAPKLLGAFVTECREIDSFYRFSHGLEASQELTGLSLSLEEDFPMDDRFAPAAALFLAAMLIEMEDETISDRFFARYADEISRICQMGMPAVRESIGDVYGFLD